MQIVEPPSCHTNIVLIGENSLGQWVALERSGLFGGLFVNRADAVRYALFENGRHPEALVSIAGHLELDIGRASSQAYAPIDVMQQLVA